MCSARARAQRRGVGKGRGGPAACAKENVRQRKPAPGAGARCNDTRAGARRRQGRVVKQPPRTCLPEEVVGPGKGGRSRQQDGPPRSSDYGDGRLGVEGVGLPVGGAQRVRFWGGGAGRVGRAPRSERGAGGRDKGVACRRNRGGSCPNPPRLSLPDSPSAMTTANPNPAMQPGSLQSGQE